MRPVSSEEFRLGSISIKRLNHEAAVTMVYKTMQYRSSVSTLLAFCNAHTATLAFKRPDLHAALSDMIVLNDGVGMEIAARLTSGHGFPANLCGTDFVPLLLGSSDRPLRLFILGAKPGVIEQAATVLARRFPQHHIVGFHDGYFPDTVENKVVAKIRDSRPDILLVGMGNPRQELFMHRHAEEFGCQLAIGVGALFDFITGSVCRAPLWMRRMRMEWLYRLTQEPRRLAYRYTFEMIEFVWEILQHKRAQASAARLARHKKTPLRPFP